MLVKIAGMSNNSALSILAPGSTANLDLTGLSEAQEAACRAALDAFLERNRLVSWGVKVNLVKDGLRTCRLDISVAASAEFDFEVRTSQVTVDRALDLGQVVDLCLETHYNACMNRKAMSNRTSRRWKAASVKSGARY
jgi:hypothetical protein